MIVKHARCQLIAWAWGMIEGAYVLGNYDSELAYEQQHLSRIRVSLDKASEQNNKDCIALFERLESNCLKAIDDLTRLNKRGA